MQALLELLPLVAFIVAYKAGGIYAATGALMAAMAVLLLVDWVRTRRIPALHGISAALVFAFGALTLLLRDERFIQWKPTVFFWAVGVAFLASQWVGAKPLAQRLMAAAVGDSVGRIERTDWLKLNLAWIAFYIVMGAANLAVVFNYSQDTWVNFKVYGITAATLVFVVAQSVWLTRRAVPDPASAPSPEDAP
jgi:intracellular septation protein